jgi:hypothetical protein
MVRVGRARVAPAICGMLSGKQESALADDTTRILYVGEFFGPKESPKNYRIGLIGSPPTKSAVKAKKVEALVFGTLLR